MKLKWYCMILYGLSLQVYAQSQSVVIDNKEDREVTVVASRSQASLESMPLHTTLISQEDIQKSPATTLDQLLRNIPGINLSAAPYYVSDPTGTNLKMRGLANAKVLVMVDGIPIHDPFYSTIQWFKAPLSSIDHIEFIRGGGSSLWGNLAVAGVINIVTKNALNASNEVTFGVGNMGSQSFSLAKNILASDRFQLRISADYFNTDGYIPTPTLVNGVYKLSAGQIANSDNQVNVRVDSLFKINDDTKGFLKFGVHQQNQYLTNELGQNLQQAFDLSAGLTHTLSSTSFIDGKLWYQNVIFDKKNATGCWAGVNASTGIYSPLTTTCVNALTGYGVLPPSSAPIYKYISQTDYQPYSELGTSWVYTSHHENGTTSMGVDSRRLSATDTQLNYNAPTVSAGQLVPPSINTLITSQATQQFIGTFYQQKYRPIDAFEATLGLRLDTWTNSNANVKINSNLNNQSDQTSYSFDPSLSLKYYVDNALSFRSSIYKGFRAPGMNNMYRSYGSTNSTSISIANPSLSPETLYGWEIGTDYKSDRFDLSATYYSLQVQNMNYSMVLSSASSGIAGNFYNTIKQQYGITANSFNFYSDQFDSAAKGLEFSGKWRVSNHLTFITNYLYTNAFLTNTIDPVKNPSFQQLGGVSPNVGIIGVDWRITPKLKTYWQVRAVSQAYLDTAQTISMPGYVTIDFNVQYQWDPQTVLTTNVINLFNQGYYTDGGSSSTTPTLGMPIFAMVGLKHTF